MSKPIRLKNIRGAILEKYGSLSRFAVLSGIPIHVIQDRLNRESNLEQLAEMVMRTEVREVGNELKQRERDMITVAVSKPFDVITFCKENGFYPYYIRDIVDGKVKYKTAKVRRLMKCLNLRGGQ